MYKACFDWYNNYGVEKWIFTGVYEVVMMYICCYVVGEDWYDVIMYEIGLV